MKKFGIIVISTLVVLGLITGFLLHLAANNLEALLANEVNKRINGKVEIEEAEISLFKNFPGVQVNFNDVLLSSYATELYDTLLEIALVEFDIDFWQGLKYGIGSSGTVEMKNLSCKDLRLKLYVDQNGSANWDIMKNSEASVDELYNIEDYTIHNASVSYLDEELDLEIDISQLNQSGSARLEGDLYTFSTWSEADSVSLAYKGISLVQDLPAQLELPFVIDWKQSKYTFDKSNLGLSDFETSMSGDMILLEDSIIYDLKFLSENQGAEVFYSLLPDLDPRQDNIEVGGGFAFDGYIEGTYTQSSLPKFEFNGYLKDASFAYTELPSALSSINGLVHLENLDGLFGATNFEINKLKLLSAGDPFEFDLKAIGIEGDPAIQASMRGAMESAYWWKFMALDSLGLLNGRLNVNADLTAKLSAVLAENLNAISLNATASTKELKFKGIDLPEIIIENTKGSLQGSNLNVQQFNVAYNSSRASGQASFPKMLDFVLGSSDEILHANIMLNAESLNLNDLLSDVNALSMKEEALSSSGIDAIDLPPYLNVALGLRSDLLVYDQLNMRTFSGNILIKNQVLHLEDVRFNLLGGAFRAGGTYHGVLNEQGSQAFDLTLGISDLDMPSSFAAFTLVKNLAPIFEYTKGRLSTSLNIDGFLGDDMRPVLASLNGGGFVRVPELGVKQFKPLNLIAEELNNEDMKSLETKNLRLSFEFEKGEVNVLPFKLTYKDIDMDIGGRSGFNGSIDYDLDMVVPSYYLPEDLNLRKQISKEAKSKGIEMKDKDKYCIHFELGGTLRNPSLSYNWNEAAQSLTSGLKQEASEIIEAERRKAEERARKIADSLAQAAKNKLDSAKNAQMAKADSLKNAAEKKRKAAEERARYVADSLKKEAERRAKEELRKRLEELRKKAGRI